MVVQKSGHFTFEVLLPQVRKDFGGPNRGRRGKLTHPLFITPTGVLEGFPIEASQFFTVMPKMPILPESDPRIPSGSGYAVTTWVDLERSARFKRWLDGKTEDTRMSLNESFAIFKAEGRDGLKRKFSKTHVFYLLREFKKNGWLQD